MPKDNTGDKHTQQDVDSVKSAGNSKQAKKSPDSNKPASSETPKSKKSQVSGQSAGTGTDSKAELQIKRLLRSVGMEMPSNKYRAFLGHGAIPPVTERKHFVARLKKLDRVEIVVLEGDEEQADKNVFVGEVGLTNIKLREDGRAEIEIDFTLNNTGTLTITLTDRISETECSARFILPQFMSELRTDADVGGLPIGELSQKIDLLEQQMQLLKGELAVRRERE